MKLLKKIAAVVTLTFGLLAAPSFASAEDVQALSSNFQDSAGVIKDDTAIRESLNKVPGKDLWVVVVQDFGGMDAEEWTKQTFIKSKLQKYDALLAVSVGTSEIGAHSGGAGLTKTQLKQAYTDSVKSKLHDAKWDEGVGEFVDNAAALANGHSIDNSSAIGTGALIGGALLVGGGIYGFSRVKRKRTVAQEAEDLAQLSQRASSELIKTDDDVRAAVAELEFARAEFGTEATKEFSEVLAQAQAAMQRAFAIRTTLDDPDPETPEEQRALNSEILQLVEQAQHNLESQKQSFGELRNLAARVESKIVEVEERHKEIGEQVPLLQAKLDHLSLSYNAAMLTSLQSYPEQLATLLQSASATVAQAREQVANGKKNAAVQYVQLAESTVNQAAVMIKRIDDAPKLLGQAQERLHANIASLSSDVADAERIGGGDPAINEAKIEAQAVLAKAKENKNLDVLAINEELQSAEAKIDFALMGARAAEENQKRFAGHVQTMQAQAQAAIDNAEDFINAYRAGITHNARTYLARAKELMVQAQNSAGPLEQQLAQYEEASKLAERALRSAQSNVQVTNGNGFGGGGNLLTGILLGSILSGHSNSSFGGGGFGDGGFGGFDGFDGGGFREGF